MEILVGACVTNMNKAVSKTIPQSPDFSTKNLAKSGSAICSIKKNTLKVKHYETNLGEHGNLGGGPVDDRPALLHLIILINSDKLFFFLSVFHKYSDEEQ